MQYHTNGLPGSAGGAMLAGCAVSADWRIGPSVVTTEEEEAGGWWLVADTGYTNIPDTPTPRRTPRPLGKHGSLWHHVIVDIWGYTMA